MNGPAQQARKLASEGRFLTLCRIGFIGRGLLFILIGVLVVGTGRTEDLTGALEYVGRGTGRVLLIGIAVGMAAYGLWRFADSVFGMETRGTGNKALLKRAVAAVVGIIYLYLAYKAVRILEFGSAGDDGPQQQARTVLDLPGGGIVLGVVALVLLGAGLFQLRTAMSCSFLQRLDEFASSPVVKWLGRIGYAARGVIFLLVGFLIGRAAIRTRSAEAGGMEEALDMLSGPLLYSVALGLVLFGAFSIIEGLYRRIHAPPVDKIERRVRDGLG